MYKPCLIVTTKVFETHLALRWNIISCLIPKSCGVENNVISQKGGGVVKRFQTTFRRWGKMFQRLTEKCPRPPSPYYL